MHEANFTQQIVKTIFRVLAKCPAVKPKRVRVRVGEMLHLVPESVTTHFKAMTRGTTLENVCLDLVEVPVEVKCRSCGREGEVEDHHLPMCRHCASTDVEMVRGHEVWVESVEASRAGKGARKWRS